MRTCEASGLNRANTRPHWCEPHVLKMLEEKPCRHWHPEPSTGSVARQGKLRSSCFCVGSLQVATSSDKTLEANCWTALTARGCSCGLGHREGDRDPVGLPIPTWIPHQLLWLGVCGCEMAKMCSWKLLYLGKLGLRMSTVECFLSPLQDEQLSYAVGMCGRIQWQDQ